MAREIEYRKVLETNTDGWHITVHKPILTDEEYAARHKELEKATIALLRDNPPKGGAARGCCTR